MSRNQQAAARGLIKSLAITGTSTGGTVVPAVSGCKLRLLTITITTDTAGNISIKDNADTPNVLVGPMPLDSNGGFSLPWNPEGHGDTATGKQLDVLLSNAATTFGGVVTYQVLSQSAP